MVAWRQAATGEAWQEVRRATEDKWSGRRGRPARGKAQMQWFHMGINGASKREKKSKKLFIGEIWQYFSGLGNIILKIRSRGIFEIGLFSSRRYAFEP